MYRGLSILVSGLLVVLVGLVAWSWLEKWEENEIVNILASQEEELGLPVYAQFVVTQTLYLESEKNLQRLEIPMYWPDQSKRINIELIVAGKRVERWQYRPGQMGTAVAELELDPSRLVAGELEVEFSAGEILHAEKEMAPRLFVETADGQYPDGNYRIAENEKQGDVSMRLVEIRQIKDRILLEMGDDPLKMLPKIGFLLLAVFLLVTLPVVLFRLAANGSAH